MNPDPAYTAAERVPATELSLASGTVSRNGRYIPGSDWDTERTVLLAEIAALRDCIAHRNPRVKGEVDAFLSGAERLLGPAGAAPPPVPEGRVSGARDLVMKGSNLYYGYVRRTNRVYFVVGVLASALAVATVLPVVLYVVAQGLAWLGRNLDARGLAVFGAADLPALMVLFGFAGLGSAVSVLSRLDKLTVPQVFTKPLVIVSGAGRPFVAAVFASVVYALVQVGPIKFGDSGTNALIHPSGVVHWWCIVVAFLCGYSERFASDLLAQSPFLKPEQAETPPPAEPPTRKAPPPRHG